MDEEKTILYTLRGTTSNLESITARNMLYLLQQQTRRQLVARPTLTCSFIYFAHSGVNCVLFP